MNRAQRNWWLNFAWFQAAWPVCVIGAAHGWVWPGVALAAGFTLWQLAPGRAKPGDATNVFRFLSCGLVLDTAWQQLGIVAYASVWPAPGFAPIWLLALWVALGLGVNHSLAVFRRNWLAFALLASVGSPLSYAAAARLGAVTWLAPDWLVILCLGPVWALLVALLFRQAERDAVARPVAAARIEEMAG